MTKIATCAAAVAALACAGPLRAHHSISMIEISTPIWVKGTVVLYEPKNPHTMIELDAKTEDGQVERWTVEGPFLGRLARYDLATDFLKPGDVIEVCGFVPRANVVMSYPPPRFVHGHLLVLPNGQVGMRTYGKLDNCVRPGTERQAWLDFLSNAMAREVWCGPYQAAMPLSALASKSLVNDINSIKTNPCD